MATSFFPTVAAAVSTGVDSSVHNIRVDNYANTGDGGGGFYADVSNGSGAAFTSGGRAWYLSRNQVIAPEMFGALGDGVADDTAAIQKWLSFAGMLTATKGKNYRLTGQVSINSNSHIIGNDCTLIHDTSTVESVINISNRDNVVIDSVFIDGKKELKSISGTVTAYGVQAYACSNLTIQRCRIFNTCEHGIRVGSTSSNLYILDNILTGNGNSTTGRGFGVWLFGGNEFAFVERNSVYGPHGGGLALDDTSNPPREGVISRRAIFNSNIVDGQNVSKVGMIFEGSQFVIVSSNVVSDCSTGIVARKIQSVSRTQNIIISDNTVSSSQFCIRVSSIQIANINNNILSVINPDTSTMRAAIDIYSQTAPRADNIFVSGNRILTTYHGIVAGIDVDHANGPINGLKISNNTLEFYGINDNIQNVGIFVYDIGTTLGTTSFNPSPCVVSNNNISGGFYIGIDARAFTENGEAVIRDNVIRDYQRYGIRVSPSGSHKAAVVHGNTTSSVVAGTAGLRLENAGNVSTTVIAANVFSDNTSGTATATVRKANIGLADS